MFPGVVAASCEYFDEGDVFSVSLYRSQEPVAVGVTLNGSDHVNNNGMVGKALSVYHMYSDHLWLTGSRKAPSTGEEDELIEQEPSEESIEVLKLTQEETDQLLEICFFQTIKRLIKDHDLPLPINRLYTLLLTAKPPGEERDLAIKNSSYKKALPFFREMEQRGYIGLDELQEGVYMLETINRNHIDYERFRTYAKQIEEISDDEEEDFENPFGGIFEGFYLPKSLLFLLENAPNEVSSAKDMTNYLTQYVNNNDLSDPNAPANVVIDRRLSNALYNGKNNLKVSKRDLFTDFRKKLKVMHTVNINGIDYTRKGKPVPIRLQCNRKGGNKMLITIYNLENYGIDPDHFKTFFSRKFSTSASTRREGDQKVMTLGGKYMSKDCQQYIYDMFGIPKQLVEVIQAKPKKKRRN
eukprot:TRINITY_DN7497_c0_g1_i2.p1 TRINITY_DN7497_c0_g1~~TRINITY_DN7497_c0_g1_i2.p1  ORF type:complete len:411 (-),score=101.10 TRINITY_DN7497_c0_g1_i2:507-1739(-)